MTGSFMWVLRLNLGPRACPETTLLSELFLGLHPQMSKFNVLCTMVPKRSTSGSSTSGSLVPREQFPFPFGNANIYCPQFLWWQIAWEYAKLLWLLVPALARAKWVPLENSALFALGVIFPSHAKQCFLFRPVVKERLFCNNKAILNFGNSHRQFWRSCMLQLNL